MMTSSRKRLISSVDASWGRASDFTDVAERDTTNEISKQRLQEDEDTCKLPYFKVCLFATILEDIIPQFRILDVCNTELKICNTMADMVTLLADKYGVEKKAVTDELDDIDPNNLNCLEYKLKKLQADRNLVMQVFNETYLGLCTERHFQAMSNAVNHIEQRKERFNYLAEEEFKNKQFRREMNRQLRQQRNHNKSITYDTNGEIELLKSQVEDSELNDEIRNRYVDGWQRSRSEQHLQTIIDKEILPTKSIEDLKRKVEQEQHVHTEIELLTNIKINEVLEKVEDWMGKYEKDMERMDLKIQIKKNDLDNMHDKRLGLEDTIAKHAVLIKDWVKFKDDREAARKYREKMTNAAITIQSWWRGLLVRNQLGPYKPVKKKGAGRSDDKTKKKGK